MLNIKTKAPDFTLLDKDNKEVALHDFLGQKVVLYFYPMDDTPGCTVEACKFRDSYEAFKNLGTVVIGISKDSPKSHLNFVNKYELPFILLADPNHEVIEKYDAWAEHAYFGKPEMATSRITYLIDEEGYIIKAYAKVDPETTAKEILDDLGTL